MRFNAVRGTEKPAHRASCIKRSKPIGASPTDVVIEENSSINAQTTIALLKKSARNNPTPDHIFVVADNAPYYRSLLVKEFLSTSKIKILFLPHIPQI